MSAILDCSGPCGCSCGLRRCRPGSRSGTGNQSAHIALSILYCSNWDFYLVELPNRIGERGPGEEPKDNRRIRIFKWADAETKGTHTYGESMTAPVSVFTSVQTAAPLTPMCRMCSTNVCVYICTQRKGYVWIWVAAGTQSNMDIGGL